MNKALLIDWSQIATTKSGMAMPEKSEDVRLLEGVKDVIHKYAKDGYAPFVMINAPGISAGTYTIAFVQNLLRHTLELLAIKPCDAAFSESNNPKDYFFFPNPGMIYTACRKQQLTLNKCVLICAKKDLKKAKEMGYTGKILPAEKAFSREWKKDFAAANTAPPAKMEVAK